MPFVANWTASTIERNSRTVLAHILYTAEIVN